MVEECICSILHHRRYQRLLGLVFGFMVFLTILLNLPKRTLPSLPFPDEDEETLYEDFDPAIPQLSLDKTKQTSHNIK